MNPDLNLKIIILLLIGLLAVSGCSIEVGDFADSVISATLPAYRNQVLEEDDVISVLFDRDIERGSAENAVYLESVGGDISGSRRWADNRLIFYPDSSLKPGRLYFLNIVGSLIDRRGRIFPVRKSIPFFFGASSQESLGIEGIDPPSGTTLTDRLEGLHISFSLPVEREALQEALSITPWAEVDFSWEDDSTGCVIVPEYGWEDGTLYSVSLYRGDLLSEGGVPFNENFESFFPVRLENTDATRASISIVKLDFADGFPAPDPQPDMVRGDETVLIGFERPVDRDRLEALFSTTPYCPGSLYWKNESTAVFIHDRDFAPNTVYHIQLSDDFSFVDGENSFTTAADLPDVVSVTGDPEDSFPADLDSPVEESVLLSPSGPQGAYTFFFTYETGISDPLLRQKLQHRCGIDSLFPRDIPPPVTVGYMWTGPSDLMVQVTGIGSMNQDRTCYYTLTLPDGSDTLRRIYLRYEP